MITPENCNDLAEKKATSTRFEEVKTIQSLKLGTACWEVVFECCREQGMTMSEDMTGIETVIEFIQTLKQNQK